MIERTIGRGGMGVVYAARDPELRRRVAIKVLRSGSYGRARGKERIKREARAMARLVHPNVVTVYDVGQHGDRVYIVMELVEGMNLRSWLLRKPRGVGEILEIFAAAGRGLAAAHVEELVHRDFKPENVLLQLDRTSERVARVAIADFGLASDAFASVTITGPQNVLGTPAYMAPEQRRGAPTTAHADQFSFCVALEEALTAGATGDAQAIPRRVRDAVARGLEKDPRDRHRSMTELVAILESSRAVRSRPRRRAGAVLGALALAGLGLVGLVAVAAKSKAAPAATTIASEPAVAPSEPVVAAPVSPTPPSEPRVEVSDPPRVTKAPDPPVVKPARVPALGAPTTPRSNEDL